MKQEQEECAYKRLVASATLAGSLISETDPAKMSETLGKIISNGETNLEQIDASANPSLFSQTHMTIASAQVDLANMESDEVKKTKLIQDAMNHCDAAMAAGLAIGTTFIPAEVIPWSMAVLAGALRSAQGEQRLAIRERISRCGKDLPGVSAKQSQDERRGIEALCESQTLLAVSDLGDPSKRSARLQDAMQLAREARQELMSAGDFEVAGQARETLRSIQTALERPSPRVAATASVPSTEQLPGAPKAGMGGKIRNFILTFTVGTVISLTLPLLLGITNPLLLSGIGFAVTFFVGRLIVKKGETTTARQPTAQASTVTSAPAGPPPIAAVGPSTTAVGEKFCISCGSKIPVSDGFCERCGAKQP